MGICSQIDLDFEVEKAAKYRPAVVEGEVTDSLLPASETQDAAPDLQDAENVSADEVFKNFASLDSSKASEEN